MCWAFPADTQAEMTQQKHALVLFFLAGMLLALHSAEPVYHIVKKGETLYGIAHTYKISVEELMAANKIRDAKTIQPGVKLLIPQPQSSASALPLPESIQYTVKTGDTIYSISRQFNTSVETISKMNSLGSTSIKPGQKLTVPSLPGSGKPPSPLTKPDPVPAAIGPSTIVSTNQWPCAGELYYLQGRLSGVSIKAKSAASLIAVRAGTVISAGPFLTLNNVVFVQANDGLMYVYGGFISMRVKAGDAVRKGTELGSLASDGESTAYFFVFKGSTTIDPAKAPRD